MPNHSRLGPEGLSPTRDVPGAYQVYCRLVATAISSDPASRPALGCGCANGTYRCWRSDFRRRRG